MTAISDSMFENCKGLQKTTGDDTFVIPATIKKIGASAFKNCTHRNFKTVTMNEGLEEIGANAFDGCTKLTAVVLPSTVKSIGKEAYLGCIAIKTFSMMIANDAEFGENVFKGTKVLETITVKAGSTSETYAKAWVAADKDAGTFSSKLKVEVK
jgi:hypothetical protein